MKNMQTAQLKNMMGMSGKKSCDNIMRKTTVDLETKPEGKLRLPDDGLDSYCWRVIPGFLRRQADLATATTNASINSAVNMSKNCIV